MQKRERLKKAAIAVFGHLKSNIAVYLHLIGALTTSDYIQIIFWLKVLLFRMAAGMIQQRLEGQERSKNVELKKRSRKISDTFSRRNNGK